MMQQLRQKRGGRPRTAAETCQGHLCGRLMRCGLPKSRKLFAEHGAGRAATRLIKNAHESPCPRAHRGRPTRHARTALPSEETRAKAWGRRNTAPMPKDRQAGDKSSPARQNLNFYSSSVTQYASRLRASIGFANRRPCIQNIF